jgi:hypothetical protein
MFFVISGYVISASAEATLRRSETAGSFLKRRFMRIFPPFWLSIASSSRCLTWSRPCRPEERRVRDARPALSRLTGGDWLGLVTLAKVFGTPDGDLQAAFSPVNSGTGRWRSSSSSTCACIWRCWRGGIFTC